MVTGSNPMLVEYFDLGDVTFLMDALETGWMRTGTLTALERMELYALIIE